EASDRGASRGERRGDVGGIVAQEIEGAERDASGPGTFPAPRTGARRRDDRDAARRELDGHPTPDPARADDDDGRGQLAPALVPPLRSRDRLPHGPRPQRASWKMIPRVKRSPACRRLTPCRIAARKSPRAPRTGRVRQGKIAPSPRSRAIASPRDCIRGRCSTRSSSPPEKSRRGSESSTVTWRGKTSAP